MFHVTAPNGAAVDGENTIPSRCHPGPDERSTRRHREHRPQKARGAEGGKPDKRRRHSRIDLEDTIIHAILSIAEDHVDTHPSAGPPAVRFEATDGPPGQGHGTVTGEGLEPQIATQVAGMDPRREPLPDRRQDDRLGRSAQARDPDRRAGDERFDPSGKRGRGEVAIEPDFVGFEIPDVFVVGYGLDFDGTLRQLDHVAALDEADIAAARATKPPLDVP